MKFSTELKPAPTWNVPVGRSPTSKLMLKMCIRDRREDGHSLLAGARDEPELRVQLEDEAGPGRARTAAEVVVEARRRAVPEELDLAPEVLRRELDGVLHEDAGRGEEAVVARVVGDGGAE